MKQLTIGSILRRSLIHRKARSVSALIAMTVSAGVATALLTLYTDLDAKLHKEFRSFGANIVLTAPANSPLPPDALSRVQQIAGPDASAAEFAYAVATTPTGTPVVVAGIDFTAAKRLNSWWQVDTWPDPSATGAALFGQRAATIIGNGQTVALTYAGRSITLQKASRLTTGGDEDSRIYMPLAAFTAWTSLTPSVIEIQIPGSASRVEEVLRAIRLQVHASNPNIQIQPVRQLVEGESRIVDRTHALMYGAVLLIALTVAVSVLATLSSSVYERRRDFALMKALGGSQHHILVIFLLETIILSLLSVVAGFIVGSAAAWAISETNFHTATLPHPSVLPLVLLLNIVIATLAAFLPIRTLRSLQPAALLRGE
ncbi:MAG: FtsX-like permease family protein [Edaphobacter sp.]